MRIVDVREVTAPIASSIANAYIDFSKMTCSLVAVVTDVVSNGDVYKRQGDAPVRRLPPLAPPPESGSSHSDVSGTKPRLRRRGYGKRRFAPATH